MTESGIFQVRVVDEGPVPVVELEGELDVAVADEVWDKLSALISADTQGMVLDLSRVGFMDSRGLSVLIRTRNALAEQATVTLQNPEARVRDMLDVAGLTEAFRVV